VQRIGIEEAERLLGDKVVSVAEPTTQAPRVPRSTNREEEHPFEPVRITSLLITDEIRVRIKSALDIVAARQKGRELAKGRGFGPIDLAIIATAISELARNIVLYAHRGEIILKATQSKDPQGIFVVALDEGPGIADAAEAMQRGYSTSGGLGLAGVRRLMDEFEIVSEVGRGTMVTATIWKR
jgi:serine/threonine-protein kinase RsbT